MPHRAQNQPWAIGSPFSRSEVHCVIRRKTQDIAYWIQDYHIDDADHEFIYDLLAESGTPVSTRDLALAIIRRHMQQEERFLREELARAHIYDPQDAYQVGDVIYFPAFDLRKGEVLAVRPGNNPEHGEFDVITVQLENARKPRSFAARLQTPHKLNRTQDEDFLSDGDLLTPEDILAEAGDAIIQKIETHLASNPDYFVRAGRDWLTTDQLIPVNIGHLNIAEALIEMEDAPLTAEKLLEQVDLDSDMPESIRSFSLDLALENDERFIRVQVNGKPAWYLRRLMPQAALEIPPILRYEPVAYDRSLLNIELLQLEYELQDEWSDLPEPEEVPASAVYHLIYPHEVAGTIPLTPAIRKMLPPSQGHIMAITLVDGRWGKKFPGWVVPQGRYIAGLDDWYKEHKLPVGTRITFQATDRPNEFLIDFKPQRAKRHWVRLAIVQGRKLVFQTQQKAINVDVDDQLLLTVGDPAAVEDLREMVDIEAYSVEDLVAMVMPELVRMSPQATAHVKTLYSAINLLRRLPPGPIFAALVQTPGASDTGSGFWSLS